MTPEERWRELKEMTGDFNKKMLIKHHMIRTINEALAEAQAENARLWAVVEAVRAMRYPDNLLHGPILDGPELTDLNEALAAVPEKNVNQGA